MSTGVATTRPVVIRPRWLEGLRQRPVSLAVGGLLAAAIVFVAGVALGNVSIPLGDTIAILAQRLGLPVDATWAASAETIVVELRLPRVITAMAVGVALSLAGVTFQGLLRNPLADPYVLGTASGAALGAAIGFTRARAVVAVWLSAWCTSSPSLVLCSQWPLSIACRAGRAGSMTSVLLTGYAVGSLLAAGLAMAMYLVGHQPPPDLLLPPGKLRAGFMAAAGCRRCRS